MAAQPSRHAHPHRHPNRPATVSICRPPGRSGKGWGDGLATLAPEPALGRTGSQSHPTPSNNLAPMPLTEFTALLTGQTLTPSPAGPAASQDRHRPLPTMLASRSDAGDPGTNRSSKWMAARLISTDWQRRSGLNGSGIRLRHRNHSRPWPSRPAEPCSRAARKCKSYAVRGQSADAHVSPCPLVSPTAWSLSEDRP